MKKYFSPLRICFLSGLLGLLSFYGCEKVIDVPLKESDPSLVIEGILIDRPQPFSVKITTTKDFFTNERAPVVTDAQVVILDNVGNADTLFYTTDGIYKTKTNRSGVVGRTYHLLITRNNHLYTAETELREPFIMDSLNYYYTEGNAFSPAGFKVIMSGQEPPAPGNYLRIIAIKNDSIIKDQFPYLAYDDGIVNGSYIVSELPHNFNYLDSVQVVTLGITKGYYDYLNAVSTQKSNQGTPFDSPPANPPTNLSKGAIGYFTAASVDSLQLRIQ
jgi:hypothetical protein